MRYKYSCMILTNLQYELENSNNMEIKIRVTHI